MAAVLLVHGLGRTPLSLRRLGRRLRRGGYQPRYFGYVPAVESFDRILSRLRARVRELDAQGTPWAGIGHSLGGLLLRSAIAEEAPLHLAHLIMLGTPNQPPQLARRAAAAGPFRWLAGECGRRLASAEFYAHLPPPQYPYALLAGTRGLYGRWSPFADTPNDGIVAVAEVPVRREDHVDTFRVSHTFMMNNGAVQARILEILGPGAFQKLVNRRGAGNAEFL